MKELLSASAEPDGQGCRLTAFSVAFRRGIMSNKLIYTGSEGVVPGNKGMPALLWL